MIFVIDGLLVSLLAVSFSSELWAIALAKGLVPVIPSLRVLLPDDKAKALDKLTIITTMDTDKLVTSWNSEVFPAHRLRSLETIKDRTWRRPRLVDKEGALLVNESKSQDVTCLIVLTNVNVRETLASVKIVPLVVILSIVLSLDIGTRDVVGEMQPQPV